MTAAGKLTGESLLRLGTFQRAELLRSSTSLQTEWRRFVHAHQQTFLDEAPAEVTQAYPHLAPFRDWWRINRIAVSPFVQVRAVPGAGLGLFARCDIPWSTPIVSVPLDRTLTVPQTPVGKENFCGGFWRNQDVAGLVLCHTLGDPANPLAGYLAFLRAHPLPLNAPFLGQDDLSLESPERALLIYMAQLTQHYATKHPVLARFGLPAYQWAVSTFLSRATGGDGEANVLVPVMDLINHGGDQANVVTIKPTSSLRDTNLLAGVEAAPDMPYIHTVACQDIAAGQQLLGLYSAVQASTPEGRDFWRFRWGFVPSDTHLTLPQLLHRLHHPPSDGDPPITPADPPPHPPGRIEHVP
eukprot:GGOE01041218.1.p1 GENE.GGOE01041218.1~~GGOE01041218.1.p1  ORF type:complete len:355 (-),score=74.88 GGOE01041218.1:145-1209(-)